MCTFVFSETPGKQLILVDWVNTLTPGQRVVKFEVNGKFFDFSEMANGHDHFSNHAISKRRMTSRNSALTDPLLTAKLPHSYFQKKSPNPNFELTLALILNRIFDQL